MPTNASTENRLKQCSVGSRSHCHRIIFCANNSSHDWLLTYVQFMRSAFIEIWAISPLISKIPLPTFFFRENSTSNLLRRTLPKVFASIVESTSSRGWAINRIYQQINEIILIYAFLLEQNMITCQPNKKPPIPAYTLSQNRTWACDVGDVDIICVTRQTGECVSSYVLLLISTKEFANKTHSLEPISGRVSLLLLPMRRKLIRGLANFEQVALQHSTQFIVRSVWNYIFVETGALSPRLYRVFYQSKYHEIMRCVHASENYFSTRHFSRANNTKGYSESNLEGKTTRNLFKKCMRCLRGINMRTALDISVSWGKKGNS